MNKINEIIEVVNSPSTDDDYVLPTPEEVKSFKESTALTISF